MANIKTPKLSSSSLKDAIVEGMVEKKALDITVVDLTKHSNPLCDFLVICTGTSDRHVEAISDSVEEFTEKKHNESPWMVEGKDDFTWVILDYIDVMTHVFIEKKREFYSLEDLWGDGVITQVENKISEEK